MDLSWNSSEGYPELIDLEAATTLLKSSSTEYTLVEEPSQLSPVAAAAFLLLSNLCNQQLNGGKPFTAAQRELALHLVQLASSSN